MDREKGGLERCSKVFLMKKGLLIARKVASRTPRDMLDIVPIRPSTIHTHTIIVNEYYFCCD